MAYPPPSSSLLATTTPSRPDNTASPNLPKLGAALEISQRKNIFKHFFSQCKLVDMVCRMKSQQGRFQKKSFSRILCAFSRVFFLVLLGKMRFQVVFLLLPLLFGHLCGF